MSEENLTSESNEHDREMALITAAYFLGVQTAEQVIGVSPGTAREAELLLLLGEIANGRETVIPTGSELRQETGLENADEIRRLNQKMHEKISRDILNWIATRL